MRSPSYWSQGDPTYIAVKARLESLISEAYPEPSAAGIEGGP